MTVTDTQRKAMFAKLGLRVDKRYARKGAKEGPLLTEKDLRGGIKLRRIPPQKGLDDLGIFHGQTTGYDLKKKRKVKIQNEFLFLTKNNRFMIKGDSPISDATVVRLI